MSRPLAVLIVEDSESDAALIVRQLEKAYYEVRALRVETEAALREALAGETLDVVISDYRLPELDAPAVLGILRSSGRDLPFIVVSGTIGDETAAALMRAGAQDYVRKENLARLAPAVGREVAEGRERERRRRAEAALKESETYFQSLVEMAPQPIFIQAGGRLVYVNAAARQLFGATSDAEIVGLTWTDLVHPDSTETVRERIRVLVQAHQAAPLAVVKFVRRDGASMDAEVSAVPFSYKGEDGALVFASDITERRRNEAAIARQLEELRRWHQATLGREARILELKGEVNELLAASGKPPRYPSAAEPPEESES